MKSNKKRAINLDRVKLDRIIGKLESLERMISWQSTLNVIEEKFDTKTLRGIAHVGNDILAADERYAYSVLQDQLAQQMARQIMSCADWHEVNSGDGKNVYIEVDVVIKPCRHTLGDD